MPTPGSTQIMLWSVPDHGRRPLAVNTHHRANIFGVQFLPCSHDAKVVSAAMDHTVQLHDLSRADVEEWAAGRPSSRQPAGGSQGRPLQAAQSSCQVFYCHTNRVKVRGPAVIQNYMSGLQVIFLGFRAPGCTRVEA